MEEMPTGAGLDEGPWSDPAFLASIEADMPDPDAPEGWWSEEDPTSEELWQDFFHALREDAQAEWAARSAGVRVEEGLRTANQGAAGASVGDAALAEVSSAALQSAVGECERVSLQMEALVFGLADEACERQLHRGSGHGLVDWLALQMTWADRVFLGKVAVVARACRHEANREIRTAIVEGRFPVRRGAIIVRALEKIRKSQDAEDYAGYLRILLRAAGKTELTDALLQAACDHLLEVVLDDEKGKAGERAAHEMRSVTSRPLGKGLTRFTIDAPERQAQVLEGLMASRLAAPQPGPDGEPDERLPEARRFDALMAVIGRGLACPEGTPQMARATLFITMGLDQLRGERPGKGQTLAGGRLSAGQVRQAACEAEIIPAVLGSQGELLDMGKAVRLATGAQIKALYLRDKGCTFPGCTVPAQWTIAHHAPWWSRGGRTDLDSLALLCEGHHSRVHRDDLTCTIDGSGVTWHL
ncbi:HNH endonuclease signature motif containing protein [Ornithinimicrobium tianjinense]|uniref:HNH endonuclease n=1 Tax=Ornithinimicrobium tianjinense TaxID=1195761 RepID=A0A917BTY7_9MICO|nr:HNH endonuclease signature motif containing protein [Ornithinimicrobium tianjinense]GGF58736.1 HNH endonuclease [Ornithinimicrobium tianjinense]